MSAAGERNPALLYVSGTLAQRDHDVWIERVKFANYGDRNPETAAFLDGRLHEIDYARTVVKRALMGELDS